MQSEAFHFFWRKDDPFSQWYKRNFVISGVTYNCAEQYMMAEKARLFKDDEALRHILSLSDPRDQKAAGRRVRGFREGEWEKASFDIVWSGNEAKFSQNPDLMALLLATSPKTLVEASPYDRVWGIGLGADDPRAGDRSLWRGENRLGGILTNLRTHFEAGA